VTYLLALPRTSGPMTAISQTPRYNDDLYRTAIQLIQRLKTCNINEETLDNAPQ
jgi:hypothetical protein